MTIQDKKISNIALAASIFIALSMFTFEVEKTPSIDLLNYKGIGHTLILFSLNAGGIILFYLAGQLRTKNSAHANVVFFFSVGLRVFVGWYIEELQNEQVFASGERYTMQMGNVLIAFIEIAFAFTQSKGNAMEAMESAHIATLGRLSNEKKEALVRQEKRIRDELSESVLTLSEQLQEKTIHLDSIKKELDITRDSLSDVRISADKWKRFEAIINKPQRKGTRYALITSEGVIVKCNAAGKHLEEVNEKKELVNA